MRTHGAWHDEAFAYRQLKARQPVVVWWPCGDDGQPLPTGGFCRVIYGKRLVGSYERVD